MYIVAGLGNPGKEYMGSRHNAGFETADRLAQMLDVNISEKKHKALYTKAVLGPEKLIIAKPQTFMNLSGESIRALSDFYKVGPENIIIIYDDIDLEPGQLRIRTSGSAGGHNGMKSIISHLGTQDFIRIRVGIGEKPREMDLADYVLGRFGSSEKKIMEEAYLTAAKAVCCIIESGIDRAMNEFNVKKG